MWIITLRFGLFEWPYYIFIVALESLIIPDLGVQYHYQESAR